MTIFYLFSAGFALEEFWGYLGLGCGFGCCFDISLGMLGVRLFCCGCFYRLGLCFRDFACIPCFFFSLGLF